MMEEKMTGQPVIQGERLILRPLQKSDAGLLELYAGDIRVAQATRTIPHPLPPGAEEAFIANSQAADRVRDVWALDGSAAGLGEILGVISLERMETKGRAQCEIGYWVAPAFWNAGLASEAVSLLLAANPGGCDTVFAEIFQDNAISARVVTNMGFEYIGDAEAFSVARGATVPTWTYLKKLG